RRARHPACALTNFLVNRCDAPVGAAAPRAPPYAATVDRQIARWRLVAQRLTTPPPGSAEDVVRHLLGVQAENASQSAWAVATRTPTPDAGDLADALASGRVLRTHVLRSTWHYVHRDDADWIVGLTGPRV